MLNPFTMKQQRWRQIWPAGWIALLAVSQLFLTIGIVASETTSMAFDANHSMIFAGFFCSLFFVITWISMFTVSCCNRHFSGCATHALIENILSILAASVLLYFDSVFLNNPFTCYFGSTSTCFSWSSLPYSSYTGIYDSSSYTVKLICIKAQLACAALMLTSNVIYVLIFIVVSVKTSGNNDQVQLAVPMMIHLQEAVQPIGQALIQNHPIQCHNCHTLIQVA